MLKLGQFRPLFDIDHMTTDVFGIKLDGRLVDFGVETAHQVKAFLRRGRDEDAVEKGLV